MEKAADEYEGDDTAEPGGGDEGGNEGGSECDCEGAGVRGVAQ